MPQYLVDGGFADARAPRPTREGDIAEEDGGVVRQVAIVERSEHSADRAMELRFILVEDGEARDLGLLGGAEGFAVGRGGTSVGPVESARG